MPSPADASATAEMIEREEPSLGMQCPRELVPFATPKTTSTQNQKVFDSVKMQELR